MDIDYAQMFADAPNLGAPVAAALEKRCKERRERYALEERQQEERAEAVRVERERLEREIAVADLRNKLAEKDFELAARKKAIQDASDRKHRIQTLEEEVRIAELEAKLKKLRGR